MVLLKLHMPLKFPAVLQLQPDRSYQCNKDKQEKASDIQITKWRVIYQRQKERFIII
jgi:hypothetical protein